LEEHEGEDGSQGKECHEDQDEGDGRTHVTTRNPMWGLRRSAALAAQGRRLLNVHEYVSHDIMRKHGVAVVRGAAASTPTEAEAVAAKLASEGVQDFVVKAQVLAGGRGKGHFMNGFQGGVHTCTSPVEVKDLSSKMIGQRLVTKQSGPEGKPCNVVYICERLYMRREAYFAILMDRATGGPLIVASSKGGVDIEEVARQYPSQIIKVPESLFLTF
jgi:succinyl-CoA synthetase beta subunit